MRKWIRRIGISVCALVLLLCGVIYVLWHNEISSVLSIQEIVPAKKENSSGPVYIMDVKGGYYFDGYLAQDGEGNDDFQYITNFIISPDYYKKQGKHEGDRLLSDGSEYNQSRWFQSSGSHE